MAILRGVLLFVFFGGLVWLAVSHGLHQESGGSEAHAAERAEREPPVVLTSVQTPEDEGVAEPSAQESSGWSEGEEGGPAGYVEPVSLDDDPYVIDVPEEHAATRGGQRLEDLDESLSLADAVAARPGAAAGGTTASAEREVPDWLAAPGAETDDLRGDFQDEMRAESRDDETAEWAPLEPDVASAPARGEAGPAAVDLAPLRSPSTELGHLVLQAAVLGDPQRLNEYLNRRDVDHSVRNLVSAFWMAVTGDVQQGRELLGHLEPGEGGTPAQFDAVRDALDGRRARAVEAGFGKRDPLAFAMTMVLLHREAQEEVRDGRFREASETLSDLLQFELDAPWRADRERLVSWGELLNNCQDRYRLSPRGEWPAIDYEVESGDNLISIRRKILERRPGTLLCTGLIEQTNDLSGFLQPGMQLKIPVTAPNALVDLDSRVVLYRHGDEVVRVWVVGIGREGHETPTGTFVAGDKQREPSWMPVGGRQLPYGHPDNPLGTRWIAWYRDGASTSYGFHGTSDPSGVGGQVSQGCIRMHNEHVEELYDLLPIGAEIRVQG